MAKKKKKTNEEPRVVGRLGANGEIAPYSDARVLGRIDEQGNITPFIQAQKQDIAPTKDTWFKKGALDDSGYGYTGTLDKINRFNAGLLMSGVDFLGNVGLGITKPVEGIGDFAQSRVADVQELFGAKEQAKKTRKKAAQEWKVNQDLQQALSSNNGMGIDDMSMIGTKGKSIPQGIGSVLLASSTGAIGGIGGTAAASTVSLGTMGLGAAGNAEQEALEQGATKKEARMYGLLSGAGETLSEMMFGGLARGSQVLGIGTGIFDSADDALANALSKKINNKLVKNFVEMGVKATGEGVEEVMSGVFEAASKKLTYMNEEDINKLLKDEKLLDSFLSGAISAGISQAPGYVQSVTTTDNGKVRLANQNEIRDYISNLNAQEQQVVEREIENRIGQEEKISKKRRIEIEKQVIEDLDRGYINANTIRDTLGENYNAERDVRLNESFNEETRRGQAYENDISKYDEKQRATIQKAIDSGLLNNSNKTHDFVDLIAKISADKGVDFDFTNNERINESGFGIKGKTVNGFVKDGTINLNLESNQALNKTVGHEITHVLEGSDLYQSLQDSLRNYLGEREWNNRISELEKTYKGVENANIENELTSDLVGDYIFNDESFIRNLSTKNMNLFQKIFDEIKYLVKVATAGSKEARDLEKAKRVFEKAYREASKTTTEGTQYSIENYRGSHQIENANDLTKLNINDVEQKVTEANGYLTNQDQKDLSKLKKILNNPNEEVTIYRASPVNELNSGDWVTTDRAYAQNVANNNGGKVYKYTVKANELFYPDNVNDLPSLHRLSSFQYNEQNVKYSVTQDSQGRELSKEQQEYFKDSKVRDENGNLKVMYHGTPRGTTTEFRAGTYFTDNPTYADRYQNLGASSISTKSVIDNPRTYEVYLDMKNPFDTKNNPTAREIFENEFLNKWGNGTPLTEKGYPDWVEGIDLQEFLETEHPEFDGFIVDEGAEGGYGQPVVDRGLSYITMSPQQVKNVDNANPTSSPDIRYSLSVKEANTGKSNTGAELSKGQQKYFKNSRATDEEGNLITVYHTMTDSGLQFNEFNPVGTSGYRFGDQVVNFYTSSKTMSSSYADYDFEMADTTKLNNIKEAQKWLDSTNENMKIQRNENGSYSVLAASNKEMFKFSNEDDLLRNLKNTFASWDTGVMLGDKFKNKYQYEGYLNLTNPYIVDANEANWDEIVTGTDDYSVEALENLSAELKEQLIDLANESIEFSKNGRSKMVEYSRKMGEIAQNLGGYTKARELSPVFREYEKLLEESRSVLTKQGMLFDDSYFTKNGQELIKQVEEETKTSFNDIDLFNAAVENFETSALENIFSTKQTTNEIVQDIINYGSGYDGVIIKNVMDYGSTNEFDDTGAAQDVYVTFNSNQFKAVDNLNPTDDADIRYRLGQQQNQEGWNVRSEDVRLQSAFKDAIAPIQEQVQELTNTINDLKENIAPMRALTEEEGEQLAEEYANRDISNLKEPDNENLTYDENRRLEVLDLLERNNMLSEEQRDERNELLRKAEPPIPNDELTPGQALEDIRDEDEVGKRSVKAYQYEHPEVKPYFQQEARGMLGDLENSQKGERIMFESPEQGQGTNWEVIGIKRFTSPEIANLLDSKWGYTYKDIEKGLKAIIEDHGAENIAVAKRIEFILDDNLRNGYTDWQTGMEIPPNQDYLNMLKEQEWNEYYDDLASQYPLETQEPPQYAIEEQERQEIEQQEVEDELANLELNYEPFMDMIEGTQERQELKQEVNNKRNVYIPKQSGLKRGLNRFKTMFTNEFAVVDDYAKNTGNLDIKFKADTFNNYVPLAQSNIETAQTDINGKAIGRSGQSIFNEARELGIEEDFDRYLKHWANVDRAKQGKGGNYTANESYKIVKELETKHPELKRLGNDMWQYYRNARHNLRDAGIINQRTSDLLGSMYPHYTPYVSENIDQYFTETGELKPRRTIKRARGGANIGELLSAEEAMQRYTFSQFAETTGNDLFKEIIKTSNNQFIMGTDERTNYVNSEHLSMDNEGYYLTAYENGDPISAKISKDMYDSLSRKMKSTVNEYEDMFSGVLNPLQKLNTVRRKILTSWSPTFIPKNMIKDIQEGVFNSKYTTDFLKNYPSAFSELTKNTELAQQFKSLYGSGMAMGQFDTNPNAKNKNFLKGITNVNEMVELAPRFAEFKASLENGATLQEAMYNAREVTTNFSRGGVITKALNRNGFTFLNSSVQGFDKFIRNFSGENGAKGVVNSLAKAVIFGVTPAVFNELAFGSGDDKDEEYEALPDYIKDNYYIIKTSNGNFIRIPKGRVLSVFGSAARRTLEAMNGEENAFEGFINNAWTQIGFNNPEENNLFAPLIQAMGGRKLDSGQTTGTAWYGGDIIPSRLQKERPEDQYDASIDKLSIWLGGMTGISPYKINYVLDQYTGGVGDILLPMMTDEANSDGSLIAPIKDQFTADTITDNKYVSEFYDTKGKIYTGSKATDEDILKNKYMNSVSTEMAKLYAERREVQASDLSKKEKYAKSQAIKSEINRLAKEGLDNYNNIIMSNNYAKIGDIEYYKNANGQWTKTTDDVASLGLDTEEKNEYYKVKNDIYTTKKNNDGYDKPLVIQDIVNSNLTPDAKVNLYTSNYKDDLIQPLVDSGMDVDSYLEYKQQDFKADKDKNGKSISGSKKRKVFDYVDSMNIPFAQKAMLIKSEYKTYNNYNFEILEYIDNSNMSYDEKITLIKNLGFKVDGDNISW